MLIFDTHSHFNRGCQYDYFNEATKNIDKRDIGFFKREYENCDIKAGAFSTYSSILTSEDTYESNEWLKNFSEENEWVYQWLVLDPRQEKLFSQIRDYINGKKVLGIKIHSIFHGYDIIEYADKIFSFADELGTVVCMHPDNISKMPYYADKYPNMKLIIAHLGSEEHIKAIKDAKYGNIFTDTSGGASSSNNIIEYAVEQVGSEKIFFGTDTYSCGFQKGRIEYARISEKDKENIFYKNAIKHFKIEL